MTRFDLIAFAPGVDQDQVSKNMQSGFNSTLSLGRASALQL